jgi:hypothetical protein
VTEFYTGFGTFNIHSFDVALPRVHSPCFAQWFTDETDESITRITINSARLRIRIIVRDAVAMPVHKGTERHGVTTIVVCRV